MRRAVSWLAVFILGVWLGAGLRGERYQSEEQANLERYRRNLITRRLQLVEQARHAARERDPERLFKLAQELWLLREEWFIPPEHAYPAPCPATIAEIAELAEEVRAMATEPKLRRAAEVLLSRCQNDVIQEE